jgi:hypothetical protein
MIEALAKEGWERDRTEEVFVTGNEILLSFYHPSFPSCDLVLGIQLSCGEEGGSKVGLSLALRSLDYQSGSENYKEWRDKEINPTLVTDTAEELQKEIDDTEGYV